MKLQGANLKVDLAMERNSLMHWGIVTSVDPSSSTMTVQVMSDGGITVSDIIINQFFTMSGAGMRYTPVPNLTYVFLYKTGLDRVEYIHLGFFMPDISNVTADALYTKTGDILYQRYLKAGEIQLISIAGSELFFSENGDIFIKNNKNSFIKLNSYYNDLEIHVPNVSIDCYNMNIKTGRVIRHTKDTLTKDYMVNAATKEAYTEFTVDIGTIYHSESGIPISVRTGSISFSDRVYGITGKPETAYEGAENFLNFLINLMSGIKVSIDESGDFHIVSKSNNSRFSIQTGTGAGGKDLTEIFFKTQSSEFRVNEEVFSYIHKILGYFINFEITENGDSSFSLRMGDNTITLSEDRGLQVSPAGGGSIIYGADGSIIINDSKGHVVILNDDGLTYNSGDGPHVFSGDVVNIATDDGIVIGNPTAAIDGVFTATKLAAFFDGHIHTGPVGPPAIPLSLQIPSFLAVGIKVI